LPLLTPLSITKDRVAELSTLQVDLENREVTSSHITLHQLAQLKTNISFKREEEHLKLKSRILWLKVGDKNSSFFHRQCKARLSRNHISEIIDDEGVIIKGQDLLKQSASRHFQMLFKDDGCSYEDVSSDFLLNVPSLVSIEENFDLMKPFSEQEIVEVIWAMESDKAPGPDGFSIHFYKACWPIIKTDLLRMIFAFQKKAKMGGCTNSTFLALIPKDVNPSSFDRFRPISLCNASYKIIAKLLANILRPLLAKLISPLQGGLVKADK